MGFAVATLGGSSESSSTVAATESGGSQDQSATDFDDGVAAGDAEASGSQTPTTGATAAPADVDEGSFGGDAEPDGTSEVETVPTEPVEVGVRYSLGPVSFLVPDEFAPIVQAEQNEDGSLRSEFAGNGGQKIVVEINPGVIEMSGIDSARELAESYRSNGRLLEEPYEVEVGGLASGVMNIEGKEGDIRADHFFNFENSGMAVVGVDLTSLDSADALARDVVSSLEGS